MRSIYKNWIVQPIIDFRIIKLSLLLVLLIIGAVIIQNAPIPIVWKFIVACMVSIHLTLTLLGTIHALVARLLKIVNQGQSAQGRDIFLIGFAYLYSICAYATAYLASPVLLGTTCFLKYGCPAFLNLMDAFYLSGVTIATVGYGDITPSIGLTKALVMLEALQGLGITAIIAGFFIGSLLSRQQQDRQTRWFGGLQSIYLEGLDRHLTAIISMENYTEEEYVRLQSNLLKDVANLVKLQFEPSPSAKVTANWMQLIHANEASPDIINLAKSYTHPLMRTDANMRTLLGILVMREWSEKPSGLPNNEAFALPVYDALESAQAKYQLTGAPEAVVHDDGFCVISDVANINWSNQESDVREAFETYFRENRAELKSFASVQIKYQGQIMGVINVQSNEVNLCGTSIEVQRIIVDMLKPFARYLGQAVVNWTKIGRKRSEKNRDSETK